MPTNIRTKFADQDAAEKLINEGKALFFKGEPFKAQLSFARAILVDPADSKAKTYFIQSVAGHALNDFNDILKQAITACLDDAGISHISLFFAWHSMLMLDPASQALRELYASQNYEEAAHKLLSSGHYADTLNDSYLCQGLEKSLIKNHDFERLMTWLRRFFLMDAPAGIRNQYIPFLNALSAQCFFNEYIFYVTEDEKRTIDNLLNRPESLHPIEILVLTGFLSLHSLPVSQEAIENFKTSTKNSEKIIRLQISEPLKEEQIRKNLPEFGKIKNKTSQAVQQQYEEHPFPRWISCGNVIAEENNVILSKNKKILIAGCGTGQQSTVAALHFPYAEVTAIDLSRASLAYATRKATERNITNITYMHGDILEVSAIGKTYDYITCGGVLHHMQSPAAGLESLKNNLARDGVMRIAVYSEIARNAIVAVQDWVRKKGFPSTGHGIREFRKKFIEDGYKEIFGETLPYFDMFSISEVRDLFFHVQEHRFTCLSLKRMLEALGLDLVNFAPGSPFIRKKYAEMFPDDLQAVNLENWHQFELQHPHAFVGMYKFYLSHKGQSEPGSLPVWMR